MYHFAIMNQNIDIILSPVGKLSEDVFARSLDTVSINAADFSDVSTAKCTSISIDDYLITPADIKRWDLNQGIKGPKGPNGPKGFRGLDGPAGVKGDKGINGSSGADGSAGIKGNTGPVGLQGYRGLTGPRGPKGISGQRGETGPQGYRGNPGIKSEDNTAMSQVNIRRTFNLATDTALEYSSRPVLYRLTGAFNLNPGQTKSISLIPDNESQNYNMVKYSATVDMYLSHGFNVSFMMSPNNFSARTLYTSVRVATVDGVTSLWLDLINPLNFSVNNFKNSKDPFVNTNVVSLTNLLLMIIPKRVGYMNSSEVPKTEPSAPISSIFYS